MATLVLVPAAWCGGWVYQRLAPFLRDAGHEVHTPTLTGLGERGHLAGPEITLDTHIADIVAVLEDEELRDAVLVGWSYGGTVITGVADRVPERIAQLIYLDARVPKDGQPDPAFLGRVRTDPAWRYREMAANRSAPITKPRETAEMLLDLA